MHVHRLCHLGRSPNIQYPPYNQCIHQSGKMLSHQDSFRDSLKMGGRSDFHFQWFVIMTILKIKINNSQLWHSDLTETLLRLLETYAYLRDQIYMARGF